ncbi:sodium-dependent nutrient amino acid transporter 1-like [Uloborus diversus]|uniref:sodium-dependent nutrient amino acid transporter 1-like n=1 Tax=Uloborus diversus TaxID=327109 RepID=UPI00240A7324|nr:sodium-dependent nutrient amino acid transporter 1-like [Uloborus diversus]
MPSKDYYLKQLNGSFSYTNTDYRADSYEIPLSEVRPAGPRPQPASLTDKNVPERGVWARSIQSLLLCISMSVGLGNVWRFPNVAYNNGGGAFLIPYLLLLFIIGRPLYYLELILGQFSSQGPIKLWKVVPAFKGIGYAQVLSVSFVVVFYNYLMALSIYYMFHSMRECLPWTECNYPNFSEPNLTVAEYYWRNDVLELDPENPDTFTHISWKLCLSLLVTWALVYLSVVQGTDSLGKMSYFTAVFPYLVLGALLGISLKEKGSWEGIVYFFKPDLKKLLEIKVWYKACEQSFFSLAIGYGNIVMISSYNKFRNNVYRDAIIISVLDTFTNLLAGCVIFAVLGTLAYERNQDIASVVDHEGLGLAFVIYPQALANIHFVPQLWSVLFFVMLFTLGIGSSMSQIETILTVIKDRFPRMREKKSWLALCVCILFFCLGLPLTTNVGQHILVLLNNYGVSAAIYFYAVLEVVGVMWIYGLKKFSQDVEYMLGSKPGIFWKVTWAFTAPVALVVIFIYGNISIEQESSGLPLWAEIAGWILAFLAIVQVPIWGAYVVWKSRPTKLKEKIKDSFRPTDDWGPADPVEKAGWRALRYGVDHQTNRYVSPVSTIYSNRTFQHDKQ